MNSEGARRWAELTKANVGKAIAIVLDGVVYSAPRVNGEISGGQSAISGNFTIEDTKDLANTLKSGRMPAPAHIVQEEVVGPTLGAQSIEQGVVSFAIAFVLLIIFMLVMYNIIPGAIAIGALLLNVFFTLGILTSFQAALTMSGIAGMVLSLGTGVDANVLIYERIKEELRAGKGMKQAIDAGFSNAFSAIIDSNLTSLITGIILYIFGTGPIQGFATTWIIGICCNVFTAVYVTRVVYEYKLKKGKWLNLKFWTGFSEKPSQPLRYEEFDLTKGLNSVQEESYSQEKNSFASEKTFTLKEDVVSSQSFGLNKAFDTAFREKKKDNAPSPEREHLCNEAKEMKEGQESLFTAPFLSEEARISHRIIGEVFQTYWLIEYGNSLYIMDQHAAHEKINFERMMRRKKEKEVFSQNIIPLSIHLSTGERAVLEEYKKEFLEMGYLWEEESNGISLTAIPVDFPTVRQEEVLLEILDGLMEDSAILEGESIYNKIASMSCKAAVKGNQKISVAECDTILQELLQLDNPFACPHGRPTIVAFKKQDLEKMFKRIV